MLHDNEMRILAYFPVLASKDVLRRRMGSGETMIMKRDVDWRRRRV